MASLTGEIKMTAMLLPVPIVVREHMQLGGRL
jgi:hypothetical protein